MGIAIKPSQILSSITQKFLEMLWSFREQSDYKHKME